MEYILGLIVIVLGFFGLSRLTYRRKPSAAEIELEKEKALVEKAKIDLQKGIEELKIEIEKREKDKSPEEAKEFWEKYLNDD